MIACAKSQTSLQTFPALRKNTLVFALINKRMQKDIAKAPITNLKKTYASAGK